LTLQSPHVFRHCARALSPSTLPAGSLHALRAVAHSLFGRTSTHVIGDRLADPGVVANGDGDGAMLGAAASWMLAHARLFPEASLTTNALPSTELGGTIRTLASAYVAAKTSKFARLPCLPDRSPAAHERLLLSGLHGADALLAQTLQLIGHCSLTVGELSHDPNDASAEQDGSASAQEAGAAELAAPAIASVLNGLKTPCIARVSHASIPLAAMLPL
jgi:hypothetical protein